MSRDNSNLEVKYQRARIQFQKAVELSLHEYRKSYFYLWVAYIHFLEHNCDEANNALAEANTAFGEAKEAGQPIDEKTYNDWRKRVEQEQSTAACR